MPINPWYYLLPYIPIVVCGGNCALLTVTLSYITDVTTPSDRAARMSYLEAGIYVGLLFGFLSSSYILQVTSPTILFGISALATLIGLLYVVFCVEESIQQDASIGKCVSVDIIVQSRVLTAYVYHQEKLMSIFDVSHVTDMIRTCFKRRENLNRSIIWMTTSSLVLSIFVMG